LLQIIAYHVESTTLEDGTYELVPEPEKGISEDQVNITDYLTEAPTKVWKLLKFLMPAPPKKASPDA
jgi:hypothetical protein